MFNNNKLCYHPLIPQSSGLKLYKQIYSTFHTLKILFIAF